MEQQNKLFMVLLGSRPKGRLTEQHDIFFGIGSTLAALIPQMKLFWPEAKGKFHIDVWREVTSVEQYKIEVIPRNKVTKRNSQLFFINLGGYKQNEFDELHHKILTVANSKAEAIQNAKKTPFYKEATFKGASSHIDDKFGVDIDDCYAISDILDLNYRTEFALKISHAETKTNDDELHIGYLKLEKLIQNGKE